MGVGGEDESAGRAEHETRSEGEIAEVAESSVEPEDGSEGCKGDRDEAGAGFDLEPHG